MKFHLSIDQSMAMRCGIDLSCCAILSLFEDLIKGGYCASYEDGGKFYYWISDNLVFNNLPILGFRSTRQLNNKISILIEKNLLERIAVKNRYYYTIGSALFNYRNEDFSLKNHRKDEKLISDDNNSEEKLISDDVQKNSEQQNFFTETEKEISENEKFISNEEEINFQNNKKKISANNYNIPINGGMDYSPSLERVKEFFQKNKLTKSDPEMFFNYYSARNWVNIRNWRFAALAWEKRQIEKNANQIPGINPPTKEQIIEKYKNKTYLAFDVQRFLSSKTIKWSKNDFVFVGKSANGLDLFKFKQLQTA